APQDEGVREDGESGPRREQDEQREWRRRGEDPLSAGRSLLPHTDPPPRAPDRQEQHPGHPKATARRAWHDHGPEHVEQRDDEEADPGRQREPSHVANPNRAGSRKLPGVACSAMAEAPLATRMRP